MKILGVKVYDYHGHKSNTTGNICSSIVKNYDILGVYNIDIDENFEPFFITRLPNEVISIIWFKSKD